MTKPAETSRQMAAEMEKTPQLGAIVNMAKLLKAPKRGKPDRDNMERFRDDTD